MKCCWVLLPAIGGKDAKYCSEKVGYKMVKDDDDNKVRKYNSFCPKHQAMADKEDSENESESY